MSQAPRFEGQQVVNSINLFVDSERANIVSDKQSRGDNVHYGFEGNTIECKDGEVIRLSLVDFHMPNNQYNIEERNSKATIIATINGTAMTAGVVFNLISIGNYYDTDDIAINFGLNLASHLLVLTGGSPSLLSVVNNNLAEQHTIPTGFTQVPGATSIIGKPEKKLLDVTITFDAAHLITNLKISCQTGNGELYLVLGGERGDDSNTLANSFKITTTPTEIRVQGFFPMQLITEPHVYLRCSLGQNGLESSILGSDEVVFNNDIISSNILAKIPRTTESFSYMGNSQNEFFLTLQQRKLNSIGLFLTDSKNRPIGRVKNAGTGTSAGLIATGVGGTTIPYESLKQNSLGNLYFTATIRVDIIKVFNPNKLQSEPPPTPQFPSRASGVISFGSPTGFG